MQTKKLTFKAIGHEPLSGRVKNPDATLGSIAAGVAARLNIGGTFECLDAENEVLDPDTRLADLPNEAEITLAPELTPA